VSEIKLQSLLDRVASGIDSCAVLEESSPASGAQFQPAGQAPWVCPQAGADVLREYAQAAVLHPHLFQNDRDNMVSHVEAVVSHFARDGLTRSHYFKALAAEPLLLRQKPQSIVRNIEAVMDHYAANQPMRNEYLQAAVDQPVLFRTSPETVVAGIEAAVDLLEAKGITSGDFRSQAATEPHIFQQQLAAIRARQVAESHQVLPASERATPSTSPTGHPADASPLPSTIVENPTLVLSYFPAQGCAR
jgi:hypothetical protein